MADFSAIFTGDDMAFARHLITAYGVACIPASPFFSAEHRHIGATLARFTFCKQEETLRAAEEHLAALGR